jgi:PBSX family phage terminase large subunit
MGRDKFEYGYLSDKAYDFFINSNAFINIAHGSVRSSKTITASMRFIQYVMTSPHKKFLITGKTRDTIKRNVIDDMLMMLEDEVDYTYHQFDGILKLADNTVYIVGLSDEGATSRVQGLTVGGWYGDELAVCPESAVKMCISRCSLPDSKIFWTLNPDNPYHYIYKEYITNDSLKDKGIVKVWHFNLDDNIHLTEEYKDNLKELYSANEVRYKRYILGLWVIAEGLIYTGFNVDDNVVKDLPERFDEINISTDYGTEHPDVMSVIGIEYNENGNKYYLIDESYYDNNEHGGIRLTDSDRVNHLVYLQDKYNPKTIFISHDASSLLVACERESRITCEVIKYTPSIYEDINVINDLFKNKRFLIHESCVNTIQQVQQYAWDAKAAARGKEVPLKQNDDCMDAMRGGVCGVMKRKTANAAIIEW